VRKLEDKTGYDPVGGDYPPTFREKSVTHVSGMNLKRLARPVRLERTTCGLEGFGYLNNFNSGFQSSSSVRPIVSQWVTNRLKTDSDREKEEPRRDGNCERSKYISPPPNRMVVAS
jgi:hypothetical protein